ncbi:hypothetical protein FW774_13060 [Pedobacter sp. BS3]|uniref:DUF6252 family protein n=1 Tax=Pedobacter sp. BS3 TaxID=2567937 RepID=UPI0011EF6AF0|nr:DUF6252 family protein [Pedobacter sp. BS3]TZF83214.1 hypothetical protein FW774_13060 [Pedobacter sp. BS3]
MKTLKTLMAAGLILFSIAACKKDKDGGDGGNAAEGTIKAKIAGSSWVSMTASANFVSTGKALTMMGVDMGGKTINLIITGYDEKPGTYEITSGGVAIAVTASYVEASVSGSKTWAAPYSGSGAIGEVKISEFSKTGNVKGTFKFKARNQNDSNDFKEITDGSFNLKVKSY